MKLNKKAIVLDFLVTVMLALIIFIPACIGVSKLFRLSDQATQSFDQLVEEIESLAKSKQLNGSHLMVMDVSTFLVFFKEKNQVTLSQEKKAVHLDSGTSKGTTQFTSVERFFNPPEQCRQFPCACLCKEYSLEEKADFISETELKKEIICENLNCKPLPLPLVDNFVLERSPESGLRRTNLLLEKENNQIRISVQK